MSEDAQLRALAELHQLFTGTGIAYWVFGEWAVDLHAGAVTRAHADLDIAIWLTDCARVGTLLAETGWRHAPDRDEDGSTAYERDPVRVELAFLARDEAGEVYTPLRDGRASWADGAFGADVGELRGVRASVVGLDALKVEKSQPRDDAVAAAKDSADLATLAGL